MLTELPCSMHVLPSFLPGKYVEKGERPFGPRQFLFTDSRIRDIQVGLREKVWGCYHTPPSLSAL